MTDLTSRPAAAVSIHQRFLTGITTSGTPHLGNFVGSIRPSVAASRLANVQSFYFLADFHALIKCTSPALVQQSTLEIAASWIAAGLDADKVVFYRQSDIPEIPELMWLLTCVTGKGLLNRAHAYKAAGDKNAAQGHDADADITAGLFMYPVLMAADILLFKAHQVPVGRDQVQHIEMARNIAQSFNHLYGADLLTLPAAAIEESVATLPGLDGRKMSKSYGNTIALFAPRAQLQKQIFSINTDSRLPGEPKETEGAALFQLYQAFASESETEAMRHAFANGVAWSEAKAMVFERIDRELAPMRNAYDDLLANPAHIETVLQAGAAKARSIAQPLMQQLRNAVGLRNLVSGSVLPTATSLNTKPAALPAFRQYREKSDGLFYFKLVDGAGKLLLQSPPYTQPQEAALAIAALLASENSPEKAASSDVQAALTLLAQAKAQTKNHSAKETL